MLIYVLFAVNAILKSDIDEAHNLLENVAYLTFSFIVGAISVCVQPLVNLADFVVGGVYSLPCVDDSSCTKFSLN